MQGIDQAELEAIDRLHGLHWFWVRTLWEIKHQPVEWVCFVLIVFALFAVVAWLFVYVTSRRRTASGSAPGTPATHRPAGRLDRQ